MNARRFESDRLLARARWRIGSAALLGALLILALTGGAAALAINAALGHADDARLTAAARAYAARLTAVPTTIPEPLAPEPDAQRDGDSDRATGIILLVSGNDGSLLGPASHPLVTGLLDPTMLAAAAGSGLDLRDRSASVGEIHVQLRVATVPVPGISPARFVVAALPRGDTGGELGNLLTALFLAALLAVGLAVLITLAVTRRALAPLREAFERERRLLADASHEMRTPVAVIAAAAELLDREGAVSPAARPLLEDLRGEALRLTRLVTDALALARLETPGADLGLVIARLEIASLLDEARRRGALLPAPDDVHLALSAAAPARILGDQDRLLGVLLALLENALRAAPPGSIVRLSATVEAGDAVIRVDDEGLGIPPAEREHVFRPFARLTAERTEGSATGLGLPLARATVEAHGGSLRALEAPGGGARLELRLPLAD